MKKMIAFLFVLIFFVSISLIKENNLPNHDFKKLVVITQSSTLFDCDKIENGDHFYYSFDNKQGKKVLKYLNINDVDGLVYYFDKSKGIGSILSKINFYYEGDENINDMFILYGYDSSFSNYRYIDGKKVNVQIVENSTNIIVGYPLILCGF